MPPTNSTPARIWEQVGPIRCDVQEGTNQSSRQVSFALQITEWNFPGRCYRRGFKSPGHEEPTGNSPEFARAPNQSYRSYVPPGLCVPVPYLHVRFRCLRRCQIIIDLRTLAH